VAVAATGREVELRGLIDEGALQRTARAAGAAPRVGLPPRLPEADDLVVVPEGHVTPLPYARLALSPARPVVAVLAPPGLFGWPFSPEPWDRPDHLSVDPAALARPEHFQRMAEAGFELWTQSPGIAEAAARAGVRCSWIGGGSPLPFPDPQPKRFDVVTVTDNRWADLARTAVAGLNRSHLPIPRVAHDEMLRLLGLGRVLAWPSRVEGHARIQVEARAMGTVPVALSTNPFADGLDEKNGAVLVDTVEEIAPRIEELLEDRDLLAELSSRARESARSQMDWDTFVARVDEALRLDPGARRASVGATLTWTFGQALELRVEEAARRADVAEGRAAAAEDHLADERARVSEAEAAASRLAAERDRLRVSQGELEALRAVRGRRSVRAALRLASLARPYFAIRDAIRRRRSNDRGRGDDTVTRR
jgi:Glycosyl transferases group 1